MIEGTAKQGEKATFSPALLQELSDNGLRDIAFKLSVAAERASSDFPSIRRLTNDDEVDDLSNIALEHLSSQKGRYEKLIAELTQSRNAVQMSLSM